MRTGAGSTSAIFRSPGVSTDIGTARDTEIDLVAVHDDEKRIRFGSCKRSAARLRSDISNLKSHADRFLNEHRIYQGWNIDYVGISVRLDEDDRKILARNDIIPQSLDDLTAGLN